MISKSQKTTTNRDHDKVHLPPKDFATKARIGSPAAYKKLHKQSLDRSAGFWAREAGQLAWREKSTKTLERKAPFVRWFVGGKLNVCENCVDRHAAGPRRNKAAIIWEGAPGDKRVLTYGQLQREVCRCAAVLENPPPLFPTLRSGPSAVSMASRQKHIPSNPLPMPSSPPTAPRFPACICILSKCRPQLAGLNWLHLWKMTNV